MASTTTRQTKLPTRPLTLPRRGQRRPSTLRRAAALRQEPHLLSAPVRAPPPTSTTLYHNPRGATAGKKREGLVQPVYITICITIPEEQLRQRKQKDSSSQMMVPHRDTFRVLEGFPIPPQHVWGPHLSTDASLPAALRCERCEVDSKGRNLPGWCPIIATQWRANKDSRF